MTKKYRGKDFLFSDDCGFINDEDGESYRYSDGSGYYHGNDGSEGYRYADDSGYFKGPSGYQTFYDAEDEQDCDTEDEEHSSALISFAEGFGNSIGTILGICVAKILDNEQRKEAEKEIEQKEREARKKVWRRQHRKGLIIVALIITLILTSTIGCYEYLIRIPVGYADLDFIGKN